MHVRRATNQTLFLSNTMFKPAHTKRLAALYNHIWSRWTLYTPASHICCDIAGLIESSMRSSPPAGSTLDVMENPPPVPVRNQKYWCLRLCTWYRALSSGQRGRVAQCLRCANSQGRPLPKFNLFNVGQEGSAIDSSLMLETKLVPSPQHQLNWRVEPCPHRSVSLHSCCTHVIYRWEHWLNWQLITLQAREVKTAVLTTALKALTYSDVIYCMVLVKSCEDGTKKTTYFFVEGPEWVILCCGSQLFNYNFLGIYNPRKGPTTDSTRKLQSHGYVSSTSAHCHITYCSPCRKDGL